MPDINPLPVSAETRERLEEVKDEDQSYDDLLQSLVTIRHRSDLAATFHRVAGADAVELVPVEELETEPLSETEQRRQAEREARRRSASSRSNGAAATDADGDGPDSGDRGHSGDESDAEDADGAAPDGAGGERASASRGDDDE